jgi:FtsZ-binding cell division protein ZapB
MAELTKDSIKEALGFIADGKRILGIFDKAESAIAVLGQLNATVESLGKKAEILRAEVSGLEARKKTLDAEWEKSKSDIAAFTTKERMAAGKSAMVYEGALRKTAEEGRDAIVAETAGLAVEKVDLVNAIVALSRDRDGINGEIDKLKGARESEQGRLDAILAKIAELKNSL